MKIYFTQKFKKRFKQLPAKVQNKFEDRIKIFIKNPNTPQLQNHPLKGYLTGLRAFSITGNYRVIYRLITLDSVKLVDIGTHNQIYK